MGRPADNSTKFYGEGRTKRNKENHRNYMMERRDKDKQKLVDHFGDRCDDCGGSFPVCCYDFHHIDPSTNEFEIAPYLGNKYERVFTEAKKCVMICSNCHRIRHYKERQINS